MTLSKNRVFVCPVSFRTQKKAAAAIRIPEAVRADPEQKVVRTDIVKAPEFPIVKDTTPNITNPRLYDTA